MKYYVVGRLQNMSNDRAYDVSRVVDAHAWETAAVQAGNNTLVEAGETVTPYADLRAFHSGDWNYWLMAVVELRHGLPIAFDGNELDMPPVDHGTPHTSGPNRIVASFDTDDGSTFVQRMMVDDVGEAVAVANQELAPDGEVYGIYGAVMEEPDGRFVIFTGREPIAFLDPSPGAAPLAPADRDVINHHRRMLGMAPLDDSMGWSNEELR
jgi:hypothetical protein